jgi:hypothetical protein
MSLDRIIRQSLWNHPEEWVWGDMDRFLMRGAVRLVRPVVDDRWCYCVSDLGAVRLSLATHLGIEWARRLKSARAPLQHA